MTRTFSTFQLLKVVQPWCALYILASKFASCHNGLCFVDISTSKNHNSVQLFISDLVSRLHSRRWSEPTFGPPEPQIIRKTQYFATFLPFRAPASSFFLVFLTYSSLISFFLLFSYLTFSSDFLLCFSSVHIVGGLTPKPTSITSANLRL